MKKFSQITSGLVGQPMLKILSEVNALESAGQKVFHFEVGDSDFDAYEHVVDATKKALDQGHTRYVNSLGIEELRQAICDYTDQKIGFRPALRQVAVMPANSVIDFVIRCVADPGEEVIVPDPGFPTYTAVTSYLGVKAVKVPLREENGFRLNPDDLEKQITTKTRLIIINTPGNPTGAVMTQEEIKRIAEIAAKYDIYILSDEIYAENIYSGARHYSPGIYDLCQERTIILSGFSKGHSMSGWRLGYAIGPAELIEKMGLLFQTVYTCLPPFIQHAGISALHTGADLIRQRMSFYQHLRDRMIKGLNSIPGVSCLVPEGAIYVFPNIKRTGMASEAFARYILKATGVALVPGSFFGANGEGHVRLCYLRKEELIDEACEKMGEALAGSVKMNVG